MITNKDLFLRIFLFGFLFVVSELLLAIEPIIITVPVSEDTTDFPNPERGFERGARWLLNSSGGGLSAIDVSDLASDNLTLVQAGIWLGSYKTSDIPSSAINTINNSFQVLRSYGLKANVRVRYTDNYNDDTTISWIQIHIHQLAQVLNDNADVINVVEAGYLGPWGEWHRSINTIDQTTTKQVGLCILSNIPSTRMMVIRTPQFKRWLFDNDIMNESKAFNGSFLARTGFHNDAFLADGTDMGTYVNRSDDIAYIGGETKYTPFGGETVDGGNNTYNNCANAIYEMETMHMSYQNIDWHPNVIQYWKDNGCFDTIKKRLGYRFVIKSFQISDEVAPGGVLQIIADITNVGFSSPFNQRPVKLVLQGNVTSYTCVMNTDVRKWYAKELISFHKYFQIPKNINEDHYKVALYLPDYYPSIASDARYAIRVANLGVWDSTYGYNVLDTDCYIYSGANGVTHDVYTFYETDASALSTNGGSYTGPQGSLKISFTITNNDGNVWAEKTYSTLQDWSSYSSINFYAKGDGIFNGTYYVYIVQDNDNNGSADDRWYYNFNLSGTNWTQISIPFSSFLDPNWDTDIDTSFDAQNIYQLYFMAYANNGAPVSGTFWVDECSLDSTKIYTWNNGDEGFVVNQWLGYGSVGQDTIIFYYTNSRFSDTNTPSIPELIFPINGQMISNMSVNFYWNHSTDDVGIDHYIIIISSNNSFTQIEQQDSVPTTNVTYTLTEGIKYWKVKSIDSSGNESDFSVIESFHISIITNNVKPATNFKIVTNTLIPKFILSWQNANSLYTILYTYDSDIDGWISYAGGGGNSTLSQNITVFTEGVGSIQINYNDSATWDYAGMAHNYTSPGVDWSGYNGLHFYYKSDGLTANRNFYVYIYEDNDSNGTQDDVWYYQMSISDANWHVYDLSWSVFSDVAWDTDISSSLDGNNIFRVAIVVESSSGAQSGTYYVDSFGLLNSGVSGYDGSKVVRQTNTDPIGPSDGVVIFNGAGTTCEDTNINLNVEYHYAVYNYTNSGNFTNFATTAPIVIGKINNSFPDLYVKSIFFDVSSGIYNFIPGHTLLLKNYYDNDGSIATKTIITVIIPTNTMYIPQSASQSNNYHTGESGTIVEVYNGTWWVSDTGVYDAVQIKKIRWILQQDIARNDNSEGTDITGQCDGDFPDSDSGVVTYKVIIK